MPSGCGRILTSLLCITTSKGLVLRTGGPVRAVVEAVGIEEFGVLHAPRLGQGVHLHHEAVDRAGRTADGLAHMAGEGEGGSGATGASDYPTNFNIHRAATIRRPSRDRAATAADRSLYLARTTQEAGR